MHEKENRKKVKDLQCCTLLLNYRLRAIVKGEPRVDLSSPVAIATSFVVSEVLQGF